jgi:nucleotide-binding universal stress UspA family protein
MKNGLKILVPYDGSSESDNALKEAIEIAQAFNSSITLQHVFWDQIKIKNEKMIEITDNIVPTDKFSLRMRTRAVEA